MQLSNLTQNENEKKEKIFSVSEYISILDRELRKYRAKIIGEVSKVDFGPTGNVYFHLKDEKNQALLKCLIYKDKYDLYGIKLEEGLKIITEGHPNLHKIYSFAFIAEVIEYSGEGALRKEYERLKKKLTREGLFAEERKRKIPSYPQRIGVITSLKGGAVIADFSNNLGKFGFKIKMVNSRVDGQVATPDLLLAIKTLKKEDIEVLVIMRGGGSLETLMPLMPFNNELLVREVVNFPVPVIAGIGHHKDEPLVSIAADVSVSTPTAAANLLNKSWTEAIWALDKYQASIINNYSAGLRKIENNIGNHWAKISSSFKSLLLSVFQRLEYIEKLVHSNSPERQLNLGYSIASHKGKIIKRIEDIELDNEIDLRVSDGTIISKVKEINKKIS